MFSFQTMKLMRQHVSQMAHVQDWIKTYLSRSQDTPDKNAFFWCCLAMYEFGDFAKHLVYRLSYDGKRWNKVEVEGAFGEVILALFCTAEKAGLDIEQSIRQAMEKYNNQEWKQKKGYKAE